MTEAVAVAGLALAWLAFRYERHRRWRDAVDAAYGTLDAVHHGMVEGLPGERGWGHIYFQQNFPDARLIERVMETRKAVEQRRPDQVFVVPPEPLAKLATTAPQTGLIEGKTVAVASFALWKVHMFNQLVGQLTDFNAQHAVEIRSEATTQPRRDELADAAAALSELVHGWGTVGRGRALRTDQAGTARWSIRSRRTCATWTTTADAWRRGVAGRASCPTCWATPSCC